MRKLAFLKNGANPYLAFGAVFLLAYIFYDPAASGFIADTVRPALLFGIFKERFT